MENLLQQLRSPSSKGRKQKRGQTTSVTLPLSAPKHSLPSSGLKTQRIKKSAQSSSSSSSTQSDCAYEKTSLCCGGDFSCSPNNAVSGPSVIRAAISKSQPLWKYFKKRNKFISTERGRTSQVHISFVFALFHHISDSNSCLPTIHFTRNIVLRSLERMCLISDVIPRYP